MILQTSFFYSWLPYNVSGFDALAYQEHLDYSIVQSTDPEYNKALVRVNIFRDHRQTIQVSDWISFIHLFLIDMPTPIVAHLLDLLLVLYAGGHSFKSLPRQGFLLFFFF